MSRKTELINLCQQTGFATPIFTKEDGGYSGSCRYYQLPLTEKDEKEVFPFNIKDFKHETMESGIRAPLINLIHSAIKFSGILFKTPALSISCGTTEEEASANMLLQIKDTYERWRDAKQKQNVTNRKFEAALNSFKVLYTSDNNRVEQWFRNTDKIFGMDLEWHVQELKVVSISSWSGKALIWHQESTDLFKQKFFIDFLTDNTKQKIFVDYTQDKKILKQICCNLSNFTDVRDIAEKTLSLWGQKIGKPHLYRYLLNMSAPATRYRWLDTVLSSDQIRYCLADCVCPLIFFFSL